MPGVCILHTSTRSAASATLQRPTRCGPSSVVCPLPGQIAQSGASPGRGRGHAVRGPGSQRLQLRPLPYERDTRPRGGYRGPSGEIAAAGLKRRIAR